MDSTIVESGSIGGPLLTRFAEKDVKYRLTANSIRGSILWKIKVPKKIAQDQVSVSEVPYVLFVLQAEEFCDLVSSGSFFNHVRKVRSRYPTFTICYVTNTLMNYIKKQLVPRSLNYQVPTAFCLIFTFYVDCLQSPLVFLNALKGKPLTTLFIALTC